MTFPVFAVWAQDPSMLEAAAVQSPVKPAG